MSCIGFAVTWGLWMPEFLTKIVDLTSSCCLWRKVVKFIVRAKLLCETYCEHKVRKVEIHGGSRGRGYLTNHLVTISGKVLHDRFPALLTSSPYTCAILSVLLRILPLSYILHSSWGVCVSMCTFFLTCILKHGRLFGC